MLLTPQQVTKIIGSEAVYQTSRSGGSGGQNVNKVETRVELSFDVAGSQVLSPGQKSTILEKLSKNESSSLIRIVSQAERSQLQNKKLAGQKLVLLLQGFLKPLKKRKATKPSRAAKEKKLRDKKRHSETKQLRKRID